MMMMMMSAECAVDSNRKQNIDYAVKDDEKCFGAERSVGSLFAENNGRMKRDNSPGTCQQNNAVDMSNEAVDNPRINMDKKSDTNNHTMQSDANGKRQKTVCYDFKKGICRRRFCRYPHVMNADQVIFCHDYQNNGCFRTNCRFIHRTIEDEEHYRAYGVFPMLTERPAVATNMNQPEQHHIAPPSHPPHPPPPPHLNYYQNRENMINQSQPSNQPAPIFAQNGSMPMVSRRRSFGMGDSNLESLIPSKRPHMEDQHIRSPTVSLPMAVSVSASPYNTQSNENTHQCRFVEQNVGQAVNAPSTTAPNSVAQVPQPQPVSAPTVASVVIAEDVINIYRLYEEHNLLRRRVEINEERLQELRATNTYLLQQNEQLRRRTQCSCTNTIVNPVTLTTASQQSTPVLNAVSIAPVQVQATPIVSIASIAQPQTQIIASSAPIAIAATTSQGQQLALASTQNLNLSTQQAGQILGTPQITLATAPSMGITMNTSQSLAMSANATQPIISYPVMTHSILPH